MKLFKVTYRKMCHPSKGIFFEDHEGYYLSKSLDELYDYVENVQHLTLTTIEILECEIITSKDTSKNENNFKSVTETTIIKAM